MYVVTVTNIKYKDPTDAPTELVFGFDEHVDINYLDVELRAHIEEETSQAVDTFEYTVEEQPDDQVS
jgi:hypothetical protein